MWSTGEKKVTLVKLVPPSLIMIGLRELKKNGKKNKNLSFFFFFFFFFLFTVAYLLRAVSEAQRLIPPFLALLSFSN